MNKYKDININEWKNLYLNNNKSGIYSKEKILKENMNEIYKVILEFNKDKDISFSEMCYKYVFNIKETPKCNNKDCNNDVKFKNRTVGYQSTCSNSCSTKINYIKSQNTLLINEGVLHPSMLVKNINKRIEKRKNNIQTQIGKEAKLIDYIWSNDTTRYNDLLKIKCDKCDKIHEIYYKVYEQRIQLDLDWRNCVTINRGISNGENEILEYIRSIYTNTILHNDRKILNGKELDIYLPELNIAFEYNGLYWHSELFKIKEYHYNKWKECKDNNIQLIQIYEDDWKYKKNIVKSRINSILKLNDKIYARKCSIKELLFKEVKEFINDNHLQGSINSNINLGLFYNNELVSVMTFGKPRKSIKTKDNNDNTFELYRFCSKQNLTIVGGASKLFKYFINNFNPSTIYSYSALEWQGNVYEKIGMKLNNISKYSYWFFSNTKRVSRHTYNKHNLTKLGYDNLKNCMKDLNIYRIYGVGNMKYIYYNKKPFN